MKENFAIQLFEGKQVRIVWDAEKEKYYFAVADIVEILTESKDVKQYIKRMRVRDPELNSKWGTICTPVEMIAPDGKRRKTQASDLEGIFRIIQSIPSKKAENRRIAKEGGNVAKEARQTMERRLGHSVISPDKASDYLLPNNEEDKE